MKLTIGILTVAMVVGGPAALVAVAQNPDAIDNARSVAKSLQQKQANDTDAALNAAGVPAAKPAPGAPAPAVKPAVIPGPTASAPAKPASKPAATTVKSQPTSAANNQLQKINVVPGGNDIQIEITSSSAVSPKVSRLSSPARVLVELPDTSVATSQNKIPVSSGGVKDVRVGMDGKNPPTTSVVVDLEKALSYDVSSGPTGKFALILHTQGGSPAAQTTAKATPAAAPVTAKSASTTVKPVPVVAAKAAAPVAKVTSAPATKVADAKVSAKPAATATKVADGKASPGKASAPAKQETKIAAAKPPAPTVAAAPAIEKPAEAAKPKPEEKKWAMNGKRDPFFSPVIQQQGSGCSTGKKCLEINGINLRGVVKSDNGFIAVVTNNIGKAYFLHENDPVFNGYVVKITGDSIVFEETVQDKLGKTSTREVVKRIFTPAV